MHMGKRSGDVAPLGARGLRPPNLRVEKVDENLVDSLVRQICLNKSATEVDRLTPVWYRGASRRSRGRFFSLLSAVGCMLSAWVVALWHWNLEQMSRWEFTDSARLPKSSLAPEARKV